MTQAQRFGTILVPELTLEWRILRCFLTYIVYKYDGIKDGIMREVVITDIHYRMTMTAIWSLGKKGMTLSAVAFEDIPAKERLGFYSKYVTQQYVIPSPRQSVKHFINGLSEIGKSVLTRTGEKPILIIPSSATHEAIMRYDEDIKLYFDYMLVSREQLERANNTQMLSEVAKAVGVPFPQTTYLNEKEDIEALSQRITYPVVVKYQYAEKLNLKPHERYKIIHDKIHFQEVYKAMHAIQPQPLVQSYVSGYGYAVSVVFDDYHQPVEIFCHKRIREYPISGGPSTLCESVWDDRMVNYAVQLLTALNWKGFAMVEFKGTLDGDLRLMEINPRFWGSMMLSLQSGCDLPFAYYKATLGLATPNRGIVYFKERYQLKVRMQFVLQDLLATKSYYQKKPLNSLIPLQFIKDVLNPKVKDGIFRMFDPKPGLQYMMNAIFRR